MKVEITPEWFLKVVRLLAEDIIAATDKGVPFGQKIDDLSLRTMDLAAFTGKWVADWREQEAKNANIRNQERDVY